MNLWQARNFPRDIIDRNKEELTTKESSVRETNLLFDNSRLLDDPVAGTAVGLEAEHWIRSHHTVVFAAVFVRAD